MFAQILLVHKDWNRNRWPALIITVSYPVIPFLDFFSTREDPRGRCARSSQAGNCWGRISPSVKLAFKYGAFGAKDRYCQADFFAQLFQNKSMFFGSRQMLYRSLIRVIFGTPFGTPNKCVSKIAYEADANFRHGFAPSARTDTQTNRRAQVI